MKNFLFGLSAVLLFVSCKKDAGDGGNSAISGKVTKDIRIVLSNPATFQTSVPASDQDVYIIYGDHISPDDRVQANYEGDYEFKYLRPGKYKIYTFSADTNSVAVQWDEKHMTILREVEITDKKQNVVADKMTIYDTN